jgi:hypothetical protein
MLDKMNNKAYKVFDVIDSITEYMSENTKQLSEKLDKIKESNSEANSEEIAEISGYLQATSDINKFIQQLIDKL